MKKYLPALLCVLFAACASTKSYRIDVGINSLASSEAPHKMKYMLVPGNANTNDQDLQFKEYAGYINKILAEQGFVLSTPETAEIFIGLFYSTELVGQQYSTSASSYTPPKNTNPYALDSGTRTTTTAHTSATNIYGSVIVLTAYDAKAFRDSKRLNQVWQTQAFSSGRGSDLRLLFPAIAVAMQPFIGTDTKGREEYWINLYDDEVEKLRGNDEE